MMAVYLRKIAILGTIALFAAPLVGQESSKDNDVDAAVVDQNQIRPAFRAEPIVHRLEARRGEIIPFEFTLHSSGRPTRLLIKPIAITQRENGVIASNEAVPAPNAITLEGKEEIELASGEDYVIRGKVRVPIVQSTFHSFGILVRDLGLESDSPQAAGAGEVRFGVRFVTQYLLRCDILVQGVRAESIGELEFESVFLEEENGLAKLQTYIKNPTDSPMSIGVRANLRAPETGQQFPPFNLAMPIRSHLSEPEFSEIRILANTRLRLESFIPHPLLSGDWVVDYQILDGRRVGGTATLPLTIDSVEFPAQNSQLIALPGGVIAEPGQVELSLQRGGKRLTPVAFTNHSDSPVTLKFRFESQDKNEGSPFLTIRPEKLEIRPGSKRNLLLMMRSTGGLESHQYGSLKIETMNHPQLEDSRILVGLISRDDAQPELRFGDMAWNADRRIPALELPVENVGGKHLEMKATLQVVNVDGASVTIPAGFGRWLIPGEKDRFRFRFKELPPAGQYQVYLKIEMGDGVPPIETSNTIEFSTPATSPDGI